MARIRTIKPELPQSESLARLPRDVRLLFLYLFTVADDTGRFRAHRAVLCGALFPFDNDVPGLIEEWLRRLANSGHIQLYEVDGTQYGAITKWRKHQYIQHPGKSRIPPPSSALMKSS